jgi:4-hydroxythreonine-4-phosphate dehydrogenase
MLQALSGVASVGMLMAAERTRLGGSIRVLLATTHIPLRDVALRITEELLVEQGRLLWRALRSDWGLDAPRIALCALNPHASDQGLFGDEEERVFQPAVERLRAEGMTVSDPLPADTVFGRALAGEFDAVVAPYHDVGMAAFKTAAFGTGVNVTLGLPFVRTSPDHGTAFDLARRPGQADPSSMSEALRLARTLVRRRFDRGRGDV